MNLKSWPGLADAERQAGHRTGVTTADTAGIECKDEPERLVDHRHHDLQFNAGADTHAGIGAGQKMNPFLPHMSGCIDLFSQQRPLLEYPTVADVDERRQCDRPGDRYAIFQIEYSLGITADVDDIVILNGRGSACERVRYGSRTRDERNRTDRPEIESAQVEVATHKKPLIKRHADIVEALRIRHQGPRRKRIATVMNRFEISVLDRGSIIVHVSAEKSASEFHRRRNTVAARRIEWIVGRVHGVAGDEPLRFKWIVGADAATKTLLLLKSRPRWEIPALPD